jgi:hypothetical protein
MKSTTWEKFEAFCVGISNASCRRSRRKPSAAMRARSAKQDFSLKIDGESKQRVPVCVPSHTTVI